jgi:inorganic pyrophosphatase
VLTREALKSGSIVECEVIGLLEQLEDGREDHNILANLPNEPFPFDDQMMDTFREFISHVFDHIPGKQISVGRVLGKDVAEVHIRARQDVCSPGS